MPHPITGNHWKQPGSVFFAPFLQILTDMEIPGAFSSFPRLTSQSRLSQSFLRGEVLQSLHYLCGPLLDSLQYAKVSPGPEESSI